MSYPDYITKDSGAREEYDSGMRRDTQQGKPRFDLVLTEAQPYEAQMLTRYARLLARGAEKYDDRNWELGEGKPEEQRAWGSALRHLLQAAAGETDEDHPAAVWFNVQAAEYFRWKRQVQPDAIDADLDPAEDSDYAVAWLAGAEDDATLLARARAIRQALEHVYVPPPEPTLEEQKRQDRRDAVTARVREAARDWFAKPAGEEPSLLEVWDAAWAEASQSETPAPPPTGEGDFADLMRKIDADVRAIAEQQDFRKLRPVDYSNVTIKPEDLEHQPDVSALVHEEMNEQRFGPARQLPYRPFPEPERPWYDLLPKVSHGAHGIPQMEWRDPESDAPVILGPENSTFEPAPSSEDTLQLPPYEDAQFQPEGQGSPYAQAIRAALDKVDWEADRQKLRDAVQKGLDRDQR